MLGQFGGSRKRHAPSYGERDSDKQTVIDETRLRRFPLWGSGAFDTWSDETASRAFDTNYQNTKGRRLWVSIVADGPSAGQPDLELRVGSASPAATAIVAMAIRANAGAGVKHRVTLFGEVPNQWYYQLAQVAGTHTLIGWYELTE